MAGTEAAATESTGTEGTTQGTTEAVTQGQSAATDQRTASGTVSANEVSFFDPESIKGKPELEAAYKEMQKAFSKKTKAISEGKSKLEQYDQFMKDPIGSMKQLAQQHGYQLVQGQPQSKDGKAKQYNSWDEVLADAKQQVMDELKPMFGEMQTLKKQNVETYLDSNFSDWRTYEDQMMETLQAHPTLVSDPDKLYRMSIPPEVLEARMLKQAQIKLQGSAEQVQGQSTTSRQTSNTPEVKSLSDAVAVAKKRLAEQGLRAPRE